MDMRAIINLLEAYKKGDKIGRWAFIYLEPKTKSGEKSRTVTYLPFEAWHTGAETIAKLAKEGTKITVQASAKSFSVNEQEDGINFRVNEFDFCYLDNE